MEMPVTKKALGMIAAAVLSCGGLFYLFAQEKEAEPAEIFSAGAPPVSEEIKEKEDDPAPAVLKVDVKGAVARPGVYTASEGDRVIDLIEEAGSFLKKADRNQVNLAQIIEDQMVIYVPAKGEETAGPPASAAASVPGEAGGAEGMVNLNTAGSEELQTLPGIGPAKADAIIEYREANGPFGKPEDLTKVSGIGEKTFEKLSSGITVK